MDLSSVVGRVSRSAFLARKSARQCLQYGLSPRGAERHVFVAGVQRSGTNMVMDVLERSLQTSVFHESDRRAFSEYLMRDRAVIHGLAEASRAPCFVIKALCESQEVLDLMEDFPPAKTVWVFRHFHDVVNSMLRSFREHAEHLQKIAIDRDGAGWRGRGMSDDTHAVVRRLVHPGLSNASGAALMWYLRNALYLDLGLERDPRVVLVRYEALVTEPQKEFGRLFGFLGLDYSRELSSAVSASSISKRPPPPIDPEVEALCQAMLSKLVARHDQEVAAGSAPESMAS